VHAGVAALGANAHSDALGQPLARRQEQLHRPRLHATAHRETTYHGSTLRGAWKWRASTFAQLHQARLDRVPRTDRLQGLAAGYGAPRSLSPQVVEGLDLEALHASSTRSRLKKGARLEARKPRRYLHRPPRGPPGAERAGRPAASPARASGPSEKPLPSSGKSRGERRGESDCERGQAGRHAGTLHRQAPAARNHEVDARGSERGGEGGEHEHRHHNQIREARFTGSG